ncbi:MAG: N-acetylmuramoyl-L-alanine amidase [Nitrospira sp.]|nr:N-acetylmuramoyl-L-alanine amidase [Nitrospira sp.]MDH4368961.1 N-acetylmuramoyl-L-alanine amidase [Nitrospira sp.]MDH5496562.1 N-acetylmuramoyl-L-alanine amidase [Nitrospira sp.]
MKGKPASLAPINVINLRATSSSRGTRLVLDLDRQPEVTEQQAENPRRVIIALPNTSLSQTARAKATDGTVPPPFVVTQITPHAVAVSLLTTSFQTLNQFTLSDPPRLVIDVMPSLGQSPSPIEETQTTPPRADPVGTQPTQARAKSYTTIVIDPGHGGKDPGALGLRRTAEKDITLKVALRLKELLRKRPDVRVLMTRDRDVYLELEERAQFANSHGADLFVSIHVNSHPSRVVKGLEVYHFGEAKDQRALEVAARENGTPISSTGVGWEYLVADLLTTKKIEASLELAWNAKEAIVTQMNGRYDVTDHGVKTAPFYVLRFTSMPSILAEVAFISNPDEEALLRNPTFVNDVAQSLYQGILSFLGNNK